MVKEPEFEFVVELDDNDLEHEVGGTSIPCGTIIIASLTQCFGDTAIWGSCRLGTRACCYILWTQTRHRIVDGHE